MGDLVSEDHVVEELVRSVEDIPIGVADVLTVLQRLCSEHDPKAMSAVLHHAQTYALDHLPRLRRLVFLPMRFFETACHFPLSQFPVVMQELATSFPEGKREVVAIRAAHQHMGALVTSKQLILQPRASSSLHGDLGWQQEQSEGAFLLADGGVRDVKWHANGDVKLQVNGDVKWQANGDARKEALPLAQTTSHSHLLSFLSHLGGLASTVVKASDSYLLLNQQLAYMLQPSPALDSAEVPLTLVKKLQSLHSALACKQERVDAAWKQLCVLQGQVEREVSHLQEAMQMAAEAAAGAAAAAELVRREEVQHNWGWCVRKLWDVFIRKPLLPGLSVLLSAPVVCFLLKAWFNGFHWLLGAMSPRPGLAQDP
ncbi:unnamed protein product [Closterium sp. Naga37s-1]|nr:unnamed protein product [Closterium sp. Naga37s-1]